MALGGRKTERMMGRYAAVTDQTLRAAAEAGSGAEMAVAAMPHRPAVVPFHCDEGPKGSVIYAG
jgi:hypothetical protein